MNQPCMLTVRMSQAHDDYLAEHEPPIKNHIHDRAWRNTPLTEQQKTQ